MPWYVRVFMVAAGIGALVFAKHSYADAERTSTEMRRMGLLRSLSTVAIYRVAALLVGAFGVMFIALAVLVD